MTVAQPRRSRVFLRPSSPPSGDDATRIVFDLLLLILDRIGSRDEATPDVASPEGLPTFWEDRGHLYLEAEIPEAQSLDLDLCVQGGRVFVRMAR